MLYPPTHVVLVKLKAKPYSTFGVSFCYNVIDKDTVSMNSNMNDEIVESMVLLRYLFVIKGHILVEAIHLRVKMYQNIFITVSGSGTLQVTVYGGPSVLSPVVQPICKVSSGKTLNTFSISTFLAVVILFGHVDLVQSTQEKITYQSLSNRNVFYHKPNLKNIVKASFDSRPHCDNRQVCIFSIESPRNKIINVSINSLTSTTVLNGTCFYAGVSFFDTDLISTVCKSVRGIFRHRNVYSKASIMSIVVHKYTFYADINVSFEISYTECNLTRTNFVGGFAFKQGHEIIKYVTHYNQTCHIIQFYPDMEDIRYADTYYYKNRGMYSIYLPSRNVYSMQAQLTLYMTGRYI